MNKKQKKNLIIGIVVISVVYLSLMGGRAGVTELMSSLQSWLQGSITISELLNQLKAYLLGSGTVISDYDNIRLVGVDLGKSYLAPSQLEFIDDNFVIWIGQEQLMDDLAGTVPNTKILMYKTSGWNADTDLVSVCCYNELESSHEDWFLHCDTSSGRCLDPYTPHESYWMNYLSTGWRDHSVSDMNSDLSANPDIDVLFYDAIQIQENQLGYPDEFSTDSEVRNALFGLLTYIRPRLQRDLWINGAPYSTGYSDYPGGALALGKKLMDLADGMEDESFGINWGGGWYSDTILEAQLGLMDYAKQTNKGFITTILFYQTDVSEYEDLIAYYLLGSNSNTYFSFNYRGYNYDSYYTWMSNYKFMVDNGNALGKPLNNRYKSGTVYRRDFENGYVTFDMATHIGGVHLT